MKFKKLLENTTKPISGMCGAHMEWSLSSDGLLIISGRGYMDYGDYQTIPDWYGHSSSIKNVIIEPGVKDIGSQAFRDCENLRSIEIPDTVEIIGYAAFADCGIRKIDVPDNVVRIDAEAFLNCGNLETINISNHIVYLDDRLFSGCQSLREFLMPDSVKYIRNQVFEHCTNLQTLKLSKNLVEPDRDEYWECREFLENNPKLRYIIYDGDSRYVRYQIQKYIDEELPNCEFLED